MKLLIDEPGSKETRELWRFARRRVSARLLYPEARSALARAARANRLNGRFYSRARAELEELVAHIDWTELTHGLARRAGRLAEDHALRAYDSVHLAAAEALAHRETVVVTADHDLYAAAKRHGLVVANLPP